MLGSGLCERIRIPKVKTKIYLQRVWTLRENPNPEETIWLFRWEDPKLQERFKALMFFQKLLQTICLYAPDGEFARGYVWGPRIQWKLHGFEAKGVAWTSSMLRTNEEILLWVYSKYWVVDSVYHLYLDFFLSEFFHVIGSVDFSTPLEVFSRENLSVLVLIFHIWFLFVELVIFIAASLGTETCSLQEHRSIMHFIVHVILVNFKTFIWPPI